VARCAANIMKVYFKNEKKSICIEIFIHSLKYINIFLILYTKCSRKLYMFYSAPRTKKFEDHCSILTLRKLRFSVISDSSIPNGKRREEGRKEGKKDGTGQCREPNRVSVIFQ
jgi:hypothetical protein